jgi:hypothetical protein
MLGGAFLSVLVMWPVGQFLLILEMSALAVCTLWLLALLAGALGGLIRFASPGGAGEDEADGQTQARSGLAPCEQAAARDND